MIHKTAIVNSKAKISSNVSIGAYSVVGPNVEIGENSIIYSHVSIIGNTKIGKGNKIYPFASIGSDPQDLKFDGEETQLEIGANNKISISKSIKMPAAINKVRLPIVSASAPDGTSHRTIVTAHMPFKIPNCSKVSPKSKNNSA